MVEISLEALSTNDFEVLYKLYNKSPQDTYGALKYIYPVSQLKVKEMLEFFLRSKIDRYYAVKVESKSIGIAQIYSIDFINRKCKLGIVLLPEYVGNGYGKIILNYLVDIAFKNLNLHKIEVEINESNQMSIKLFEKLNFQKEGKMVDSFFNNGTYENVFIYGLINSAS